MLRLFISDLHLCPAAPELAQAFEDFMRKHASGADELYILGDFFDAWIGDDEDDGFYLNLIALIRQYADKGLPIYFQHGNRDFLVGDDFAKAAGVTLLPEQHVISLGETKALLMHGDALCTDDQAYMAFRAQVRDPQWQQQILSLPLDQRRVMAAQLRAQSQSMNSNKAEDIMDVNEQAVRTVVEQSGAQTLIHGHTHRPQRHPLASAERIVLGDWGSKAWYLSCNDESMELHHYSIE
jgi:UDP-2,3-diacylglucosamine hydrolase